MSEQPGQPDEQEQLPPGVAEVQIVTPKAPPQRQGQRPASPEGPEVAYLTDGSRVLEGEVTHRESTPIREGDEARVAPAQRYTAPVTATHIADADTIEAMVAAFEQIRAGGQPYGRVAFDGASPARIGGKAAEATNQPMPEIQPEDASRWPSGPLIARDLLRPIEVERLVEAILTDPEIMEHPTYPGLSNQRLKDAGRRAGLEPRRFGRFTGHILLWFARAGVTVQRDDTEEPWKNPRPVTTEEKEDIRRMLLRLPPPTKAEVEEARREGLKDGYI